jgi:hypothetical protein
MVWRDGRVAEGAGLLNRYTVKSRIGDSNPPLSASFSRFPRPQICKIFRKFSMAKTLFTGNMSR